MAIFDSADDFLKAGLSQKSLATGGLSAVPDQWRMLKSDFRGNRGGGTPVGDAYAALTREAWERYVTTWVPYQNDLIDYATDPNVVGDAMSRASHLVNQSFDQQQGATQRRLAGLGLTLDEDEQRAADRSFGLSRSLADVGAQNAARDQTLARRQSVLGNPAPTIPNI